ncbi:hypothetical protein Tco_0883515 [Tanacetum coccineum]
MNLAFLSWTYICDCWFSCGAFIRPLVSCDRWLAAERGASLRFFLFHAGLLLPFFVGRAVAPGLGGGVLVFQDEEAAICCAVATRVGGGVPVFQEGEAMICGESLVVSLVYRCLAALVT